MTEQMTHEAARRPRWGMATLHLLPLLVLTTACENRVVDLFEVTPDTNQVLPSDLAIPDISDIDIDLAVQQALELAISTNLSPAWDGHLTSLTDGRSGCPDVYLGVPMDLDDREDEAGSLYWSDYCETLGGLYYRGFNSWDGVITASGDAEDPAGRTVSGSRWMFGDALIGDFDGVRYRFKGEGTDSLYRVEAPGYSRWTYASMVEATVAGRDAFTGVDAAYAGGWRTDMYVYATGGDVEYLEARGNVFLLADRIQDRFDSVAMDLYMTGSVGAGADDCTLEPHGWMGLRDENAYWYDLVFLPSSEEDATGEGYDNEDYSACDGCGTLYVRGLEATEELGLVCPDFSKIWVDGIGLPAEEDFILNFHDILGDMQ